MKKITVVAGARPNFVKIAPLITLFKKEKINYQIIHTGQHYDYNMSQIFFKGLGIPEPDIHLEVGSASHAVQTAKIMIAFEKVLLTENPLLVIVVGDVNSTLACALVAKKMGIKTAHIESGLRSFDQRMPEEINRLLTDQLVDFLFVTEKSAIVNLKREGIDPNKIYYVGNIMIDTLVTNLEKSKRLNYYKKLNLKRKEFAVLTFHRPSNVDKRESLEEIVNIINYLKDRIKIVFSIHPRTKEKLREFDLHKLIESKDIILLEPIGYLEFLNLMESSKFILTDSGGIQEEASYLRIPVITLRKNTERPITIEYGTNTIVGRDFTKIKRYINDIFSEKYKKGKLIEKWDGNTSMRIVKILKEKLRIN